VPLVAIDRGDGLQPLTAPRTELERMAGYVGSVALDRRGEVLAASCPRGGCIAFWQVDGRFLRTVEAPDGCAIGPAETPGRFIVATGVGAVLEIDSGSGVVVPLGDRMPVAYDNHLTMLDSARASASL
jgi:hypothetical protein